MKAKKFFKGLLIAGLIIIGLFLLACAVYLINLFITFIPTLINLFYAMLK